MKPLLALALVLGVTAAVCGQTPDSVFAVEPYVVRIAYLPNAVGRAELTLPITLESAAEPLVSYRLLIAFNADVVEIRSVDVGSPSESAHGPWTEFKYELQTDPQRVGDLPNGRLAISAARFVQSPAGPAHDDLPDTLLTITCACTQPEHPQPIRFAFYWLTESDNVLVDTGGHAYSYLGALDYTGEPIVEEPRPGLTGPVRPVGSIPAVEFHSGGFALAESSAADTVRLYSTGDLNGNGTPWDVFDAIIFAALMVDDCGFYSSPCDRLPDSIRAFTDLDGDGAPLSLSDLATALTLVIGDVKTQPATVAPFACVLTRDACAFSVTTPAPLGAMLLTFEGEVAPWSIRPELSLTAHFRNGQTRVLIHRSLKGEPMKSGPLISVEPPEAALLSAEAVAVQGAAVSVDLPD